MTEETELLLEQHDITIVTVYEEELIPETAAVRWQQRIVAFKGKDGKRGFIPFDQIQVMCWYDK